MFEITIKSDKPIRNIQIEYDGDVVNDIAITPITPKCPTDQERTQSFRSESNRKHSDTDYLDTDITFDEVPQEIIQKPNIELNNSVNVAPELQNLDI